MRVKENPILIFFAVVSCEELDSVKRGEEGGWGGGGGRQRSSSSRSRKIRRLSSSKFFVYCCHSNIDCTKTYIFRNFNLWSIICEDFIPM